MGTGRQEFVSKKAKIGFSKKVVSIIQNNTCNFFIEKKPSKMPLNSLTRKTKDTQVWTMPREFSEVMKLLIRFKRILGNQIINQI